jgi:hypothetical protein
MKQGRVNNTLNIFTPTELNRFANTGGDSPRFLSSDGQVNARIPMRVSAFLQYIPSQALDKVFFKFFIKFVGGIVCQKLIRFFKMCSVWLLTERGYLR